MNMPLKGGFNCVIATMCNYLETVHGIPADVGTVSFNRSYFKVIHADGCLMTVSPEEVSLEFLRDVGADFVYPSFAGLPDAWAYIDWHLANRGVLPVSINLRYDILDPLPFDNDYWHFHLIVAREPGGFRMFDQFENEYYFMPEQQLGLAIDTPFNYRFDGKFTPFLLTDCMEAAADVRRKVQGKRRGGAELAAFAADYPLEDNLQAGVSFIRGLHRYTAGRPSETDMYRLMNYHHVIIKCRDMFQTALEQAGWTDVQPVRQLREQWETYRHLLGMALARRTAEEFDRLETAYTQLITNENALLRSLSARSAALEGEGAR